MYRKNRFFTVRIKRFIKPVLVRCAKSMGRGLWYFAVRLGLDPEMLVKSKDNIEEVELSLEIVEALQYLKAYDKVYNMPLYEVKWQQIRQQYSHIYAYILRLEVIGECIPAFCCFINNHKQRNADELEIYIPRIYSSNGIFNIEIYKMLFSYLNLIKSEDIMFWKYVLIKHSSEIDFSDFYMLKRRRNFPQQIAPLYKGFISVPKEIQIYGAAMAKKLGIKDKYICFFARSATYNTVTSGSDDGHGFRNADFNAYMLAAEWVKQQGFSSVKMGRYEQPYSGPVQCVDYAGVAADDMMDIYLSANCKFFVSGLTGLMYLPAMLGVPTLAVNVAPAMLGKGGCPCTEADLWIPKKYYSEKKKRYLTLMEMAEVDVKCITIESKFDQEHIKFTDNTPEEIKEAVMEMNSRLDGTWMVTEEENAVYANYYKIFDRTQELVMSAESNWLGCAFRAPIAYSYLKNNAYLLD